MADTGRPAWVNNELFPFESRFIAIDGHTVHYVDEGSGPTLLLLHGGPLGRLLVRQFNLFVNAMVPAGHRLRKPTADEMAHYRTALATHNRRDASSVLPRRITASRAFLAGVEAGLPGLASLPTLIVWGDADFAFRAKERQRWEQIFADHHTVIIEGAGHFVQSDAPDRFAAAIRDWRFTPGGRRTPPARGDVRRKTQRES
ncbi:hypothetical protein ACTWPT_52540 [Nonomuraea sp. 3N208]|uniref:hypothetical protein n=1 Tax=Nonomuraea sp. 3N208 TaxID=3457421 RepID=UPI003FD2AF33